jgi:hypothetical protein
VRSYGSRPGEEPPRLSDVRVRRAAERVTLACRALSAAVNDLRVAHSQTKMTALDDAADMVGAETEKVCELAEEVATLAANVSGSQALAATASASD